MRPTLLRLALTLCAAGLLAGGAVGAATQDAPATRPQGQAEGLDPSRLPVLDAGDRSALLDHVGHSVFVNGTVREAAWSSSGKVMNIEFDGRESGKGLLAVVFSSGRARFDEAFGGPIDKVLVGKQVRLDGDIELYGGYDERFKGRPQMILRSPEQISLLGQPGAPTTRPGA